MKRASNKYSSDDNPQICNTCFDVLRKEKIGAEVVQSFLFADVRGSTSITEVMASSEFSKLINRFYQATTHVLIHYDALIDKLIGDEVPAFFVPGIVGHQSAGKDGEQLAVPQFDRPKA